MSQPTFRSLMAALSLASLSFVVAPEAHSATRRPAAALAAMPANAHAWCLQYDGGNDCFFSTRQQCTATAAGGLGECVPMAPAALGRD
jgi:hypothetical protein